MLPAKKNKVKKKFTTGKPFNPNFDGNLLAWYDGDTLNTDPAGTWSDRSGNGFDLTLFNAPTIISPAINGHDALQFDGATQDGQNANPAFIRNQPSTVYIVVKNIVELPAGRFHDGIAPDTNIMWIQGAALLSVYAGVNLNQIYNPLVYEIYTNVYNGVNSENRINNAAAVVGNAGANNSVGLTIGRGAGGGTWINAEYAYIIIRSGADNTATQNLFINFLKSRFAL